MCRILGTDANPGLVPRALNVIFDSVKHRLCDSIKPQFHCDAAQLSAHEVIEEIKSKKLDDSLSTTLLGGEEEGNNNYFTVSLLWYY